MSFTFWCGVLSKPYSHPLPPKPVRHATDSDVIILALAAIIGLDILAGGVHTRVASVLLVCFTPAYGNIPVPKLRTGR
jgi:hypothetical protein